MCSTPTAEKAKLEQGRLRAAENNSREELFGWPTTEYPQLNELSTALEPYLNLWTTAVNFQRAYPVWMEGPLLNLSLRVVVPLPVHRQPIPVVRLAEKAVGCDRVLLDVVVRLDGDVQEHLTLGPHR